MGEEGEGGRGRQGNKGAPWLPTQPPGSHGIVEVGFELCMCVKLLGEGGLGGGGKRPLGIHVGSGYPPLVLRFF